MSDVENILFERQNELAIITLNRPMQRNAIDAMTCAQLRQAIDDFEQDPDLKVGILRGEGHVFCAGMDLKAFLDGQAVEILRGEGGFGGLVSRQREKPLIAAVQGAAFGGGFELALACDMVVADKDAHFGFPESKVGLIAAAGGAFRLGQLLPRAIANEILLTGDGFSAARAYELGLINKLVEANELDKEALNFAHKIAANAPLSIKGSLELAKCATGVHEKEFWAQNDRWLDILMGSHDAFEGAQAFAKKRPPKWQGK